MNKLPNKTELPKGFLEFYKTLHHRFWQWQRDLAERRKTTLEFAHQGNLPNYLPPSKATVSNWKIELPDWCQDQRNQMTGPADNGELIVKMLNSGAPGVMIDLEDSMANNPKSVMQGLTNSIKALKGELSYEKRGQKVVISENSTSTVVFVRPRGLHMFQEIPEIGVTSASLFDVAMIAYQVEEHELNHPLSFYIPKSESAQEAIWWEQLFKAIAQIKGWVNPIRCMALVESHPLAYQMEEFIFNLKDHILGLNLGRWDYMASLIDYLSEDPDWILPDRNTIPHDVSFFQNLRKLMARTCHTRGILAIGGMTALYPSRTDPELNARALQSLEKDKKNEADCFMDGAWTGHPDQNAIAVAQFPHPNQVNKIPDSPRFPDLRPDFNRLGMIYTTQGTRDAIRAAIRYRNGVLNGKGASLLDGYMEDLATDRICRLMLFQRLKHNHFDLSTQFTRLFNEELKRLQDEGEPNPETLLQARHETEMMVREGNHNPN